MMLILVSPGKRPHEMALMPALSFVGKGASMRHLALGEEIGRMCCDMDDRSHATSIAPVKVVFRMCFTTKTLAACAATPTVFTSLRPRVEVAHPACPARSRPLLACMPLLLLLLEWVP